MMDCTFCNSELIKGTEVHMCPRCQSVYHIECWQALQSCFTCADREGSKSWVEPRPPTLQPSSVPTQAAVTPAPSTSAANLEAPAVEGLDTAGTLPPPITSLPCVATIPQGDQESPPPNIDCNGPGSNPPVSPDKALLETIGASLNISPAPPESKEPSPFSISTQDQLNASNLHLDDMVADELALFLVQLVASRGSSIFYMPMAQFNAALSQSHLYRTSDANMVLDLFSKGKIRQIYNLQPFTEQGLENLAIKTAQNDMYSISETKRGYLRWAFAIQSLKNKNTDGMGQMPSFIPSVSHPTHTVQTPNASPVPQFTAPNSNMPTPPIPRPSFAPPTNPPSPVPHPVAPRTPPSSVPGGQSASFIFCLRCGTPVNINWKFCSRCGALNPKTYP